MENVEKLNPYSFEEMIEIYNINPVLECETLQNWITANPFELNVIQISLLSELPAEYNENLYWLERRRTKNEYVERYF